MNSFYSRLRITEGSCQISSSQNGQRLGGGKTGKEAAMCDLDDLGSSKTALNNLEQYLIFVLKASMGQGVIMPLRCLVKGE